MSDTSFCDNDLKNNTNDRTKQKDDASCPPVGNTVSNSKLIEVADSPSVTTDTQTSDVNSSASQTAPTSDKVNSDISISAASERVRLGWTGYLKAVVRGIVLGIVSFCVIVGCFFPVVREYALQRIREVIHPELTYTQAQNHPQELKVIYTGLDLLHKQFFRPLSTKELLNSAILCVNTKLMVQKKLNEPPMPLVDAQASEQEQMAQFDRQMLEILQEPKAESDAIIYTALLGLTMVANDPYTTALNKAETTELNQQMGSENYCGIGVYIETDYKNDKQLTILEPIDGGPAALADLRSGDCIIKIDDKSTKNMDLAVAAKKMRGPEDTQVKLTIKRGQKPEFNVNLTRRQLAVKSVTYKKLSDGTGYIHLRGFGNEAGQDCHIAMQDLLSRGCQRLILDLRNNGGGAVEEAITVASQFLDKDLDITSVVSPHNESSEVYRSQGNNFPKLPLVVLVNSYSASASEIVAGALKDHQRALLVGETTFGKGSVQIFRQLDNGMSIKYTIAHYLTPHSKDIHLKGIEPDVVCEAPFTNRLGWEDEDEQLKKAQEVLLHPELADKPQKESSPHSRNPLPLTSEDVP